jgi:hypothetical protein
MMVTHNRCLGTRIAALLGGRSTQTRQAYQGITNISCHTLRTSSAATGLFDDAAQTIAAIDHGTANQPDSEVEPTAKTMVRDIEKIESDLVRSLPRPAPVMPVDYSN